MNRGYAVTDNNNKGGKGDKPSSTASLDAIESLPLSIIPLTSNTLKSARLVKNQRMETAVELYNDPITGSLQVPPKSISDALAASDRDQEIVNKLAALQSFDVYSLRSSLKRLGIDVDEKTLKLSDGMKETLSKYTISFIHPLLEKIFGAGRAGVENHTELVSILQGSDAKKVLDNLHLITERTGIPVDKIPKFLEDYSDVYLSVAYYRHSFESIGPDIDRFLFWIHELRAHRDVTNSSQTALSCRKVEETMRFLSASIRERLMHFQMGFETFWGDISHESFEKLQQDVAANYASMGAVLCGLIVKMSSWAREFPNNTVGGPSTRIKFVIADLEPGLDFLKEMENDARRKLGLTPVRV